MADQSEDTLPYAPIHRIAQACVSCRRKKARCTGSRPACANCQRLKIECVYSDTASLQHNGLGNSTNTTLGVTERSTDLISRRLSSIEQTLQQLSQQVQGLASERRRNDEPVPKKRRITTEKPANGTDMSAAASPREPHPSSEMTHSVVDTFFAKCENQPYSLFHEGHFRQRLEAANIPGHLILAMMAVALRFSTNPFNNKTQDLTVAYANQSWKSVVSECLLTHRSLDVDLVQTLSLLSLFDFTAGRSRHVGAWVKAGLAVRIAQDLGLMLDKSSHLSFVEQEERRRIFWSVYLLDRFVSCGRNKPHAILDTSCHLQLPCSELSWEAGKAEKTPTLEELANRTSRSLDSLGSFGQVIAVANILGRCSQYSMQDFNIRSRYMPWDPSSDFAAIEADLFYLEVALGFQSPVNELLSSSPSSELGTSPSKATPPVFARVLFHLSYCLLNHPFLLRRRIASSQTIAPSTFLSRAFNTGLQHARKMIEVISTFRRAGYEFNASFCNYCVMVACSIIAIQQVDCSSNDQATSDALLNEAMEYLESSARKWVHIPNMIIVIRRLLKRAEALSLLSSSEPHISWPTKADTDLLWIAVDYGAVSNATPAELAGDAVDQVDSEPLPDANIWFESFFDTFSDANIGDFATLDNLADDSDLFIL